MILDSNILIYASETEGALLGPWIEHPEACISAISRIEVLGFPRWGLLEPEKQKRLEALVDSLVIVSVDKIVEERAIELRRQQTMTLGDAIIAATALEHGGELVTRNVADFHRIAGVKVINPFDLA